MPRKLDKKHYRVYNADKEGRIGKELGERHVTNPAAALNIVYKGDRKTDVSPKYVAVEELRSGRGMGKTILYKVKKQKESAPAYLKEVRMERGSTRAAAAKPYYSAVIEDKKTLVDPKVTKKTRRRSRTRRRSKSRSRSR